MIKITPQLAKEILRSLNLLAEELRVKRVRLIRDGCDGGQLSAIEAGIKSAEKQMVEILSALQEEV